MPFTPGGKRVLERAMQTALALGQDYIGTEHVLAGLTAEGKGVAARALAELGVEAEAVRDAIARLPAGGEELTEPPCDQEIERALEEARAVARRRGHGEFGAPHLLLALLQPSDGFLTRWSTGLLGVDAAVLRQLLGHALDAIEPKK